MYWRRNLAVNQTGGALPAIGVRNAVWPPNAPHSDTAHSDVAHSDVAHSDGTASKDHSDTPHSNVAHSDIAHADTGRTTFTGNPSPGRSRNLT